MTEQATSVETQELEWREKVYLGDKLPEFTVRAVAAGVLLGVLIMTQNVYMGLKLGITEAGSILAAIVSFAMFSAAKSKLSILENNIAQSVSTAAGSIGIVVSMVPALTLAGVPLGGFQIFVFVFLVATLGLFFAIPLRRQIIVIEQLAFPTGTACATTIRAMHAHGDDAGKKAKALGFAGLFSGAVTWLRDAVPMIIPSTSSSSSLMVGGYPLEQLSLGFYWSPLVLGIGLLIGIKAGLSLLLGAIAGWGILGPGLAGSQVIEGVGHQNVTHWTMWPAIALMVASGFTSLALKSGVILRSLRAMKGASFAQGGGIEFPFRFWLPGIIVVASAVVIVMQWILGVPFWLGMVAVLVSYVLATVAIRGYGETDINPVGTMGHASQIVAGTLHPGNAITNLGAGGVAAGCSDSSASLMQVFKTGYLLGATPRRQILAQFIGVAVGSIVAVVIYLAVTSGVTIGSDEIPAPGALPWSGMASLLAKGSEALPPYGLLAALIGAGAGILITLLEKTRAGKFLPSPFGMGIGLVVPGFISVSIFVGSLVGTILGKAAPKWSAVYLTPVASGGIAGEAITAVVISILAVSGVL